MEHDSPILDYCNPSFADSWKRADCAMPLFAGFIDAMAIAEYRRNESLQIVLEGPGFTQLFGENCTQETPNFIFCADRRDRDDLMSACASAHAAHSAIHINVAWNAGAGRHANDQNNFFKTIVSVEHVGRRDRADLLYLVFQDVSDQRMTEHGLARSQFSSALRALFDEAFLLNLQTGASEPIYAGGKPLMKEDGSPIDCGFHAMHTTVHRDDIKLFWKYSNYTYVESKLFGEEPEDAIIFDLRRCDESGEYHWERVCISRVESADKRKNVLVCSQNIDEQKDAQRRERELRSKAQIDGLTGIYNHGTSEELIRAKLQGLMAGEAAVFCIVDVDDFKRVNDTYGHSTGDKLLQVVASAVRSACREDDIVGRMGGDEFVALFGGEDIPSETRLRSRLENCKEQVRGNSTALGIDPPVTLSIGVVSATAEENSYNEIFDRADRLLYEAKRSGKNALRFE